MSKEKLCHCGRLAINSHFSLCFFHNNERLSKNKKQAKSIERKPIKKKCKKATGEAEVFLQIWKERKHECEWCGIFLGHEMKAHFFSHQKHKSTHNELRLDRDNIKLNCYDCHYAYGNRGKEVFMARKDINRKSA